MSPALRKPAGAAATLAGLVALWAAAAAILRLPFVPSPMATAAAFSRLVADGTIVRHAGASALRVVAAMLAAFPPAAALGMAAGRSSRLDLVVAPLVYLFHPLPKVAFLPVIMLALGLGEGSKVALVGFIIFSQILVAARDSARRIPAELVDSVRSLGGGRAALVAHVIVPATLPDMITSVRVSLGTAVAVLFMAETFATDTGLGWLIVDAWSRVAYAEMYAAIAALGIVGLCLFALVDAAERVLCPWAGRQS